jgi:hypothetical protein
MGVAAYGAGTNDKRGFYQVAGDGAVCCARIRTGGYRGHEWTDRSYFLPAPSRRICVELEGEEARLEFRRGDPVLAASKHQARRDYGRGGVETLSRDEALRRSSRRCEEESFRLGPTAKPSARWSSHEDLGDRLVRFRNMVDCYDEVLGEKGRRCARRGPTISGCPALLRSIPRRAASTSPTAGRTVMKCAERPDPGLRSSQPRAEDRSPLSLDRSTAVGGPEC